MAQFASVLSQRGVTKGDRVLIYMPMIPEAIITMLACARIGAIHSLVFGGFASKELSTRINHAEVAIYNQLLYITYSNVESVSMSLTNLIKLLCHS